MDHGSSTSRIFGLKEIDHLTYNHFIPKHWNHYYKWIYSSCYTRPL